MCRSIKRISDFKQLDSGLLGNDPTLVLGQYHQHAITDNIQTLQTLFPQVIGLDIAAKKDWNVAQTSFQTLKECTEHLLYNVYLDRIERFRGEPPPDDWDGVFAHLSK